MCKPAVTTLDAGTDGSKFEWYRDGKLQTHLSQRTALVNEVGQYKVKVFDAICPVDSDFVLVNNGAKFSAKNNYFCKDSSSVKQLEIINYVNPKSSDFEWYSDLALTTKVATGYTYVTPEGLKSTTTYYVKDLSTFEYSIGPKARTNDLASLIAHSISDWSLGAQPTLLPINRINLLVI